MKFVSWIPNLTGRLSFRRFGSDSPSAYGKYFLSTEGDMYVFFHGEIYTSDSLIKNIVFDAFARNRGYLVFFAYGIARNQISDVQPQGQPFPSHLRKVLVGRVVMRAATHPIMKILKGGHKNEDRARAFIAQVYHSIDRLAVDAINIRMSDIREPVNLNSLDQSIKDIFEDLDGFSARFLDHILVDFALDKDGRICIDAPSEMDIVEAGSARKIVLPRQTIESIAINSFNVIRNKVHVHKHHSVTNDSIVGVYEDRGLQGDWAFRIISSLREKIRLAHNSKNEISQAQCMGYIAYLKAFLVKFVDDEAIRQSLLISQDHVLSSAAARKQKLELERIERSRLEVIFVTLLAGSVGFLSILPDEGFVQIVKSYYLMVYAFIFVLLVAYAYTTRLSRRGLIWVLRFGRSGRRAAIALCSVGVTLSVLYIFWRLRIS